MKKQTQVRRNGSTVTARSQLTTPTRKARLNNSASSPEGVAELSCAIHQILAACSRATVSFSGLLVKARRAARKADHTALAELALAKWELKEAWGGLIAQSPPNIPRFVRTMNLPDARLYLQGLLETLGDCEEAHAIRSVYIHLDESDRLLELLHSAKSPGQFTTALR